jgi:hypothetical protein
VTGSENFLSFAHCYCSLFLNAKLAASHNSIHAFAAFKKRQQSIRVSSSSRSMASFWLALFLGAINLLVVCGNLFVLYILVSQKSLHTSTNTIVFSLTLSDFLLGCLILPFSILQVLFPPFSIP